MENKINVKLICTIETNKLKSSIIIDDYIHVCRNRYDFDSYLEKVALEFVEINPSIKHISIRMIQIYRNGIHKSIHKVGFNHSQDNRSPYRLFTYTDYKSFDIN